MKVLFDNSTLSLAYDEAKSLIVQNWFGELTEEIYKQNMMHLVDIVLSLPPVHHNLVYPNLTFIIPPDLQQWTVDNVFEPTQHKGLEKVAFIIPKTVFEQMFNIEFMSVEQTMDESCGLFATRYFVSEEEAFKWFAA